MEARRMAWDYEKSLGRATQQWDKTESLSISDVTREFDFEQISLLEPRRVTGTHIYVDIANYNSILRSGSMHDEDMVRLLHIFAREAAKIAESDFDAEKIHFQGPRLHAVAYRPVGDEKVMVAKAVLAGLAVKKMASAFNTEFDLSGSDAWKVAAGLDHGTCVATKNGVGGDRELLFLGNAANAAAHTLAKSGIRLTANVRDLLPDEFEDYVSESSDCTYLVSMSASAVEAIAADHGWVWSLETSESRLAELAANNPSRCRRRP